MGDVDDPTQKPGFADQTTPIHLLHFSNDFPAFRDSELQGVCLACQINIELLDDFSEDCPFKKYKNLTTQEVYGLCQRTISLRGAYEYWCEASSFADILPIIASLSKKYEGRSKSFKINLEAFNRTYTKRTEGKLEKIDKIADALDMIGSVNLNNPEVVFSLFEYYGPHGTQATEEPIKLYFGRLVKDSRREVDIRTFSLKTRKFIGNTSMDPTLAFLMANMAGVVRNSLVLDPFVGTGSLLLACAHYGAYVVGTDINKVLLHGRGRSSRAKKTWRQRDECVRANFTQYKLADKYLDVIVADASKHSLWSIEGLFDAIVTDPPYGIREQTLKLEALAPHVKKPSFMPPTKQYNLSDVFTDLLTLSSKCLRKGGRLVFWLPIYRPDYEDDNIPRHPCFELISNCEQVLSTYISRRLITLQKISAPSHMQASDVKAVVDKDHYRESFRDRYFQISEQVGQLGSDQSKKVANTCTNQSASSCGDT